MSRAPIKLLVSDIDGTLVRKDKSLAEATVEAARRLREAGVLFSLISARPLSGMLEIAARLGIDAPIGAYNGGTIAHVDGTVVSAERLSADVAREAARRLDLDWTTLWVFADGQWHTRKLGNPHDDSERKTTAQEPTKVDRFDAILDRVDKMVAVSDDEPKLKALETETAQALGKGAAVARSQTYYLDVTAPGANKGAGVTAIAKALGVPLEQTAVIGDGGNDVAMFKVAGLSIAMANGEQSTRDAAMEAARSNDDDGVADAIDRIVIPASRPSSSA